MGTDERDRHKRTDDDVEAHVHSRGVDQGGIKEPEDSEDSTPDVEAHVHKR